jgi:hypothetical protein
VLAIVLAASVQTVEASTTALRASPAGSTAGDTVTFTAAFTSSCPGALTTHYFTIDGKTYNGTLAQSGQAGTDTLSISSLTVGAHSVTYTWKINGTICRGVAYLTYTVAPRPAPSPSPPPSPTPSPSPLPSPSTVALVAGKASDAPVAGYVGGGLILFTVVAGLALAVLSRR